MMIRKKIMRILHPRIDIRNFKAFLYLGLFILSLALPISVHAAPVLTVEPVTWNIIGLDSNDVTSGPNQFPVGARVCNTGDETADNVEATFVWDSANSYIDLRPGTASTLPPAGSDPINLAAGDCIDAYFEAEVTRDAAAYDTSRRYHIEITADNAPAVSTPTPRELYVEKLVSQARNSTIDMQLSTDGSTFTSIAPGGTMSLIVGNTYWIKLVAKTATNGYQQIESFINFPNIIFQLLSVTTTYGTETSSNMSHPYDTLYGDACTWENDPNSPNYMSCLSTGKAGGDITVTFEVKILSVPIAPLINPEPLSMMIFDFSGSSFHYNSDYSVSVRYGGIVDPTSATITKSFSPNTMNLGGVSRMTVTIGNPNPAQVSGYNFDDDLPSGMEVADPPNAYNSCGSTTFSPSVGDTTISFDDGTVAANSSCIIQVDVTVPDTETTGTYENTTYNLFVDTLDTGKNATAILTVSDEPVRPSPPDFCTNPTTLATWTMPTTSTTAPPDPDSTDATINSATATATLTGVGSQTVGAAPPTDTTTYAWGIADAWPDTEGAPGATTSPYFTFDLDYAGTNYGKVQIQFDIALLGNGDWAAPGDNNAYVYSSVDSGSYSLVYFPEIGKGSWLRNLFTEANLPADETTTFTIHADSRQKNKTTSTTWLDNIIFKACELPDPPTITKAFSPDSVTVGGTSTLTFTVTNPNSCCSLSGISVDDFLPVNDLQGTVSVSNGNATVTGTGTAFLSQLAAGSIVTFPSAPQNLTGSVAVTSGSPTVTGTGTDFDPEVSAGSIIIINSVKYVVADRISDTSLTLTNNYAGTTASGLTVSTYKYYTVSSIESDTSLTLNATYTGTTAGSVTLASGLTLTEAPTTTCRGTVTGGTGLGAISLSGNRLQGTISVTNGSATVTGSGTNFNQTFGGNGGQLSVGSRISINGVNYRVASITTDSDTSLTLSTNYAGTTASGLPYFYGDPLSGTVSVTNADDTVTGTGTAFTTQLVTGDIVYINQGRYTVSSIASDTSLTLTADYTGGTGSGINIYANDILRGTVATTNGSATVTGTNTYFTMELAQGEVIYINGVRYTISSIASDTSLTLTTNATTTQSGVTISRLGRFGVAADNETGDKTCTITASVKDSIAGVITNISQPVSATETGANVASTGLATDTLTAVVPPVISKLFSPNPILTAGTSKLTFTITNPNLNNALSGIKFTDTFPSGVSVASPLDTSNTCGGTLYSSDGTTALAAGDTSIRLGSSTDTETGTISAGGSCTITVNVTASTVTGDLTGTFAVTNNSSAVTGTSTLFSTELAVGRTIYINGVGYRIASIASDTSLTLTTPYSGPSASGLTVPSGYFNLSGNVAHIINSATVNGNTASDTLMVRDAIPGISLLKQVGSSLTGPWFDTLAINTTATPDVYYQFTVENTGDVALDPVSVTDDTLDMTICNAALSAAGALPVAVSANENHIRTCVVGSVTAQSGSHTNTASSTGTYGGSLYNSGDDTAIYKTVALTIDKRVVEPYFTAAGDELNYSFLVTNGDAASLFGPLTINDDKVSATCPAVNTVGDFDNYLDPGESMICGTKLSGTVAVTNGSATVTGTGTLFTTQLAAGDSVFLNWGSHTGDYIVSSITNDTEIILTANYTGATVTGGLFMFTTSPYTILAADITAGSVTNTADATSTETAAADIPEVTSNEDSVTVGYTPTLIILSSFRGYEENGQMVIEWTTSSEIDTVGFYLYRLDETTGRYVRINRHLLPGLITSQQGGTYSLIDTGAHPDGTYTYVLVERQGRGSNRTYGPFTVQAGQETIAGAGDHAGTLPGRCAGLQCLKNKTAKIASYVDNNGVLTVTNRKSLAAEEEGTGADQYTRYTRKPRGMSEAKQVRLSSLQESTKALKRAQRMLSGDWAKISVDSDGLYYLDTASISGILGKSSAEIKKMIRNNQLTLKNKGQDIAYLADKNNTGIYFYGEQITSDYTTENIYWLGKGKGLQMGSVKGRGPSATGSGTFTEHLHIEQNTHMISNLSLDPAADHWIWDWFLVFNNFPYPDYDTRTYNAHVDGVADVAATATLAVNLQGFIDDPAFNPDQHVAVSLNGTPLAPAVVGSDKWEGLNSHTVQYAIDQSTGLLVDGDNTIEVKGVGDTGAEVSGFYLDSFDLTYQRLYRAENNQLIFRPEDNRVVTVYGFTESDILLFDITDPKRPILNTATKVRGSAGNYSVSLPAAPDRTYFAVSSSAVTAGPDMWADSASNLASRKNRADYILIAPEGLKDAARHLADYRKAQGLETIVADLEDIMDEFNYGISSPEAIRDFLKHAYQNWLKVPRYVALVGEGTYDYKNNMGFGDNLLPTLLASTPLGVYASDNLFGDVDGDHIPEMAVGRLSVATAAELNSVINKIKAYEAGSGKCVLFLSDDPDEGGNFPADSDYMASLVQAGYATKKIYLSQLPLAAAQASLLETLNGLTTCGTVVLANYIGHGDSYCIGRNTLYDKGLLCSDYLGTAMNWNAIPVFTAMTCKAGDFSEPGSDSLSEALILSDSAAAVAFWGSTGLSLNELSKVLDEGFFMAKSNAGFQGALLGDLILEAMQWYGSQNPLLPRYELDIHTLQGDPALRMK